MGVAIDISISCGFLKKLFDSSLFRINFWTLHDIYISDISLEPQNIMHLEGSLNCYEYKAAWDSEEEEQFLSWEMYGNLEWTRVWSQQNLVPTIYQQQPVLKQRQKKDSVELQT